MKDERLSQPWNNPVVLNMGPLDWEASALPTRTLLPNIMPGFVIKDWTVESVVAVIQHSCMVMCQKEKKDAQDGQSNNDSEEFLVKKHLSQV